MGSKTNPRKRARKMQVENPIRCSKKMMAGKVTDKCLPSLTPVVEEPYTTPLGGLLEAVFRPC